MLDWLKFVDVETYVEDEDRQKSGGRRGSAEPK